MFPMGLPGIVAADAELLISPMDKAEPASQVNV